ncbi:extracellular solute-binding protein [Streptomyces sp. B6B3]|uniref:ABC transporter substrate-binding protein n=1 Tax=Streptomyces sp. B6B3 TaxID=3153570 RepID=UPI00325F7319
MTRTNARRPTRRQALALPLLLAPLQAAAACSRSDAGATDGVITLQFWCWAPIAPAIDLWNRTHPRIRVELSAPAGGASLFQRLSAAIVAGSGAPDLVQADYPNLPTLAVAGYLEDLTDLAAGLRDAFVPAAWRQVVIGQRIWAVPQDMGPMGMFYRADLLDAHDLPVPSTWEEFRDVAERLRRAAPGRYLTAFPQGDMYWFAALAAANGAEWFGTEDDAWRVSIDGPQARRTAEYWTGLLDDGLVTIRQHWNPAWHQALQDGTLAAWLAPAWGLTTLVSYPPNDPDGVWRAAPLPRADPDRPASGPWGGSSTAIVRGSAHVEAAMEFAAWLNTDGEAADLMSDPENAALFPASVSGQDRPAVARPQQVLGGQRSGEVFREAAAHTRPMIWGPTMDQVRDDFIDAVTVALNEGESLTTALTSTQDRTVEALERKGLGVRT